MASGGRFAPLDEAAAEVGAGPTVINYLKARNLFNTPALALIAATEADFEKNLVEPFTKGFVTPAETFKPADPEEAMVAKAVLCHLWQSARLAWQTCMSPPAPIFPPTAPAALPVAGAASTTLGAPGQEDRPPKTFVHWAAQIKAYNDRLLDGQPRAFPEAQLVGAEVILARLWWERERRLFGPIGLGEILARRTFSASGELPGAPVLDRPSGGDLLGASRPVVAHRWRDRHRLGPHHHRLGR